MGNPKKRRKAYQKPRKAFQKERILKEKELKELYGLKNKKEVYRAETTIRKKRATARKLLAMDLEARLKIEKELLDSLKRTGILQGQPTLEDVLTLTSEALLERRLQTLVWRKGLANTVKQARQFITHGHISVNGKKIDIPSYIVTAQEEGKLGYHGKEMIIEQKVNAKKTKEEKKNKLKEEFEEAKGEEKTNEVQKEKVGEAQTKNEKIEEIKEKDTVKEAPKKEEIAVKA